jgi:hypothetical protein
MTDKTLAELEAYHKRLLTDVRKSQLVDQFGLTNHTPLMKNLRECEKQIAEKKQAAKS